LEDAQYVFHQKEEAFREAVNNNRGGVGWDDFKTILCKITTPGDFGFGSYGDVYGMEIIDSLNWDDEI